ncbi:MAG: transglutaminase family protein, partial [Cellvibrionaceae bacterium]|nr:transglutaminase family protein [Cellvibrionaceae bacterium]
MTIRVAIKHSTHYHFDRAVEIAPHTIRLRPAPHSRTHIHSYSLKVQPEEHFINWQQDAFGNYLARLVFPEKARQLSIEVEVIADMTVINPFDFFVEDYAEQYPFRYPRQLKKELGPYLHKRRVGKRFKALLAEVPAQQDRIIDFLVLINQKVSAAVAYGIRMEPGVQTPEQTLALGTGSCRDSAWLLVQLLRHLGLASRFASGYLVQLSADEKSLDGPSGPETDFTDLHAWCEVYLPGAGWVGLDPTSGLFAAEGHIPLACTPDPISAAPIVGATGKCEVEFDYSNEVTRILEDPRVTKPYEDSQWADILALGEQVDRDLEAADVRLTMGGEPTFVSIDDMESAQWNTEALGEDKLTLAKTLLLKLRDHFAPSGLLHYGQGKWYPGEPLPRWALGLFWRSDGEPLWQRPELLARIDKDYGHTIADAERFFKQLVQHLELSDDCLHPAYEDVFHYLSEEQKLPLQQDLHSAQQDGELDRKRLLKLLQQGLDRVAGLVLPIEWQQGAQRWQSSRWQFRRSALVLLPGDSPMGLRLPLEEIDQQPEAPPERDPTEPRGPLPGADQLALPVLMANEQVFAKHGRRPLDSEGDDHLGEPELPSAVRTALCIEPRDGKLHLFMPPMYCLESYLKLLAAIEASAAALKLPVVIEGYEPPRDPRLTKLLVTPDPGVIEVNVHPANNWLEQVEITRSLYRIARHTR